MYWLVYQSFIEKEEFSMESMNRNMHIFTAIRKVKANSKEEAIGKYILDTSNLRFTKRIDPLTCFVFDDLKTI